VIVGLGCLAAFFGLIGCGYILWQIRKDRHPIKHRFPLLVLVFWPCVGATLLLPMNVWFLSFSSIDYHSPTSRLESQYDLIIYATFGVIIPLIISRIFWRFFAKTKRELHFRKWITLAASLIMITSVLSYHFSRERTFEIQTDNSSYVQLGDFDRDWVEDRPIVEEAIATVIEGLPVQATLYAPNDSSLPERLIKDNFGVVHLQWRSLSDQEADKTKTKLTNNLKASLPRRFVVQRRSVSNEVKKEKLHKYNLILILPIFAPFVVALLVTNGKKLELVIISVVALITIGFTWKTSWPRALFPTIPFISDIDVAVMKLNLKQGFHLG